MPLPPSDIDAGITRHRKQECPYCGHVLDAAGTGDAHTIATPGEGDLTVCIECAGVMRYGPDLEVQAVSPEALLELFADDPECGHETMEMVQRVRAMPWYKRPGAPR